MGQFWLDLCTLLCTVQMAAEGWTGRRWRGSLGRSNMLVSRKVRRHKARWGRQAEQTLFNCWMVLGSPPLEKSQETPVLLVTKLSLLPPACMLKPCW